MGVGGRGAKRAGYELALPRQRPQVPGAVPSAVQCSLPGWLTVLLAFPHNRFIAAGDPEPAYLSP